MVLEVGKSKAYGGGLLAASYHGKAVTWQDRASMLDSFEWINPFMGFPHVPSPPKASSHATALGTRFLTHKIWGTHSRMEGAYGIKQGERGNI